MCLKIFFFILFIQWTTGWWEESHMLVAEIAYSRLSPGRLSALNDFINHVAPFFQDSPDMVTASVWADFIKTENVYAFDTWHYYNGIYNPTNISGIPDPSPISNIVWALTQAVATLNGSHATVWGKATMIRFLLHFVGDIHQPLHTMELYDSQFLNGDEGGNSFLIYVNNTKWNLHAFWDSAGTKFQTSYSVPLTNEEKSNLKAKANMIINSWPYDYFGKNLIENINYTQWQLESFQLGVQYAYLNYSLKYGQNVSLQYIEDTQNISCRQIALAGYRLGVLLNQLIPFTDTNICNCQCDESAQILYYVLSFMGGCLLGIVVMGFYHFHNIKNINIHKESEIRTLLG